MITPPTPAPIDRSSLDRSALSAFAWSATAKWSTQIVTWAGTIAVARILTPADYGLLTMATVFLGVVLIASEFGIGTAVITLRELPARQLAQLNVFSIILGFAGTMLTALFAYPIGRFFRAPDLPPVLLVLGLTFVISAFQVVPAALLRRELHFRTLAMIDVARGLLVPVVTLTGALLGLRYWALAVGNVVGVTLSAILILGHRRVPFSRPSVRGLAEVIQFSRDILISRLAWIAYQDGDFAVAGRRLGQAAAGDYSVAWLIATSPVEKVTMVLSEVTPSLFSAAQHDRAELRRYFLLLSEAVCLATFPIAVGIALVSWDLVPVLLGPKWVAAATPLALLALYSGARAVTIPYQHAFNATRETRFAMWMTIVTAILLVSGFVVGSQWGAVGIAAAWLVVHPLLSIVTFRRVQQVLGLSGADYFGALRMGLDGTFGMAVVVLAFQHSIGSTWAPAFRLAASIALGAVTYGVITWVLHRGRIRELLGWLRRVRSGAATVAGNPAPASSP